MRSIDRHLLLAALLLVGTPFASVRAETPDGPFEIDRRLRFDNHGVWSRKTQLGLQAGLVGGAVGLALYEGSESRLGRTAWQTIDSIVFTAAATQAAKVAFSRTRPAQTDDPGRFFQGSGNRSFPSGETSNVAAALTPLVLEYGPEQPWLYPVSATVLAYDMIARMKTRGHWQSDVISGAALGAGIGYLMHQRERSLVLAPFGDGVFIGYSKRY